MSGNQTAKQLNLKQSFLTFNKLSTNAWREGNSRLTAPIC
jgi:hypothetical protein